MHKYTIRNTTQMHTCTSCDPKREDKLTTNSRLVNESQITTYLYVRDSWPADQTRTLTHIETESVWLFYFVCLFGHMVFIYISC